MHVNLTFILACAALVCGVLLFIGKSHKYPLAAIAIILLAISQMGILR